MTFNEYLSNDYSALVEAANKITGNNELALDLLHYGIEELALKSNLQAIIDSGGARFYLIRICMTQWKSKTGPFYRQFIKSNEWLDGHYERAEPESEFNELDLIKVNQIIDGLDWYDRELFRLYAEGEHNYSTLSKETGIPRTSIALTIKRVRKHIKQNL